MPRYVALLRGINVGGRNKVPMAGLRRIAGELGYTGIATYIQSGNLVFTSSQRGQDRMATDLERAIETGLGVSCAVIVLSRAQLAAAIEANPFPDEPSPKAVHAVFRQRDFTAEGTAAVARALEKAAAKGDTEDEAVVVGRTLYLHLPNGMGRSELAAQLARSGAQAAGTARNWATVTKLLAMLDEDG
jgi:uncharacterized protein (DUF1697 family)